MHRFGPEIVRQHGAWRGYGWKSCQDLLGLEGNQHCGRIKRNTQIRLNRSVNNNRVACRNFQNGRNRFVDTLLQFNGFGQRDENSSRDAYDMASWQHIEKCVTVTVGRCCHSGLTGLRINFDPSTGDERSCNVGDLDGNVGSRDRLSCEDGGQDK